MKKVDMICPNCGNNIAVSGIGVTTVTSRVYKAGGYDHNQEYSNIKGYFCPKCLKTIRRKLGEEMMQNIKIGGTNE